MDHDLEIATAVRAQPMVWPDKHGRYIVDGKPYRTSFTKDGTAVVTVLLIDGRQAFDLHAEKDA